MDFSLSAIIQAVHSVLIRQDYNGRCDSDPSSIAGLVLALQKRVRQRINAALCASAISGTVDWEKQVFEPVVGEFIISQNLGLGPEDADYLMLLATLIALSYELLLLPAATLNQTAEDWLARAFDEYFEEPEIRFRVAERIETEIRRLRQAKASARILQAIQVMHSMLGCNSPCIAPTKVRPALRDSRIRKVARFTIPAIKVSKESETPRSSSTTLPRDVRIEVYLKPGQSWSFDFVDSVTLRSGLSIVKTCIGLQLIVENNVTVSDLFGIFDTVLIKAMDGHKDRSATIILPPGYSFRLTDVIDVSDLGGSQGMKIETRQAFFYVQTGDFVVARRDCRSSVLVQSNEC